MTRKSQNLISSALAVFTCGAAPSALAQCPSDWTLAATTGPTVRNYVGLTYDSTRDITVLYGGGGTSSSLKGDVWKWDGSTWTQLLASGGAGSRRAMGMCYDAPRDRTVIFGGVTSTGINGETWEWNGSAWAQVLPSGAVPAARGFMPLVYDDHAGVSILHGGWSGGTVYKSDMWAFDGTNWTQITPASGTPSARGFHSMAYDRARQRIVLFGGLFIGTSTIYYGDTWEWDGTAWSNVTPINSPPPRAYHTLTYDSTRQRVILYGGFSFDSGTFGDTWEWDGESWTQLAPANSPIPRQNQGMTYDALHQKVVVFGGNNGSTLRNDTWTLATDAPPEIGSQSGDTSACAQHNATFWISAFGPGTIQYQWRRNGLAINDGPTPHGSVIGGATTDTLSITNCGSADGGTYDCRASTACGDALSLPATLNVIVGDVNNDNLIDLGDLAAVLANYGMSSGAVYADGDFDGDGDVDLSDLAGMLASYGATCP